MRSRLRRRPEEPAAQADRGGRLEILRRLAHRGAAGSDPASGDGAGILTQIPHRYFERVLSREGKELPNAGDYGVVQCFLSRDQMTAELQMKLLGDIVRYHNQKVIGWRTVPVDIRAVGPVARIVDADDEAALHRAHGGPDSVQQAGLRPLRFGAGTSAPSMVRASVVAATASALGMTSPPRSRGRGRSSVLPGASFGRLRAAGDAAHGRVAFGGSFGTTRGRSFARGASTAGVPAFL